MDDFHLDPANREDQRAPPLDDHRALRGEIYFSPPHLPDPFILVWTLEIGGWVCFPFPHTEPYISRAKRLQMTNDK